jgi:hypothetical protein
MARAAGTSTAAARAALRALEKNGRATRAGGSRPGIPDTWTPADGKAGAPGADGCYGDLAGGAERPGLVSRPGR